ncbi:MAG: response regulator transcription factor [bacterium]
MIRVVIADDHTIVRAGLCRLLESERDIEVVGEAGTGRETVSLCERTRPDVVVLDFDMPDMDGLEATRQIVSSRRPAKVLIITMYDSEEYAVRLIQAGALGFIIKGTSPEELPAAIRKVASGKTYITPSVMEGMVFRRFQAEKSNPAALLSDRELQVLVRLARGRLTREVSDDLGLSTSTVETYRRRLLDKLGLRNNSDITRFAIRYGLIDKF